MGIILKLRLLLWKNLIVRRRNKIRFILEAVYPLFLFVVLVIQNPQGTPHYYNECHFLGKALPSAGQVPFLHSLVSGAVSNNYCLDKNGSVQPEFNTPSGLKLHSSNGRSPRAVERGRGLADWMRVSSSDPATCSDVVRIMLTVSGSMTNMWSVVKPFITGKILYYPDTVATSKIMQEVNDTFNKITTFPPLFPVQTFLEMPDGIETLERLTELFGDPADVKSIRNLSGQKFDASALPKSLTDAYEEFREAFEKCVNRQKVEAVPAESALTESWKLMNSSNLWALVSFEDVGDELKPFVHYKIRVDENTLPPTKEIKRPLKKTKRLTPLQNLRYIVFGFAYLQDMIDSAILKIHTGRTEATQPGRILQQFPSAAFKTDDLADLLTQVLPLMMALAWIYTFSQTVKGIVVEKEERVKEVLAVMGISRGVQSAGWVVEGICSTFLTCIVLSVLLKFGGLMTHSDISVLFVLLFSFVVSMLSLALFVSTFFSRPTLAGPCSGVIYFLTYYLYQVVRPSGSVDVSGPAIVSGCLASTVALAEATQIISSQEMRGDGAQWSNIFLNAGVGEPVTLAACIGMMWLDACIYALLAWYTENVFPGEFGIPKPYFFFLKKSYWFGSAEDEDKMFLELSQKNTPEEAANFEPEPQGSVVGVAIENLSKVFGKQKPAVNGLTLNFHQDQINCFLGHNGAGKTTTISMLTGMYPPTAGTARLFGRDIRTEMDDIRTSMGVCPQHNVLFSTLTVEEHLLFFGRIKGISEEVLKQEIDYMLKEMGLEDKRKARSNTLSGGMKRKLSVGMAFVGGSKVVFLDEPTAGVDPFSRRGIWELLLKFRKGRTIILTTHFMDEADLLGDRIAIMSEGRLQCCGSSVFLKERLGTGYHLTVEWKENDDQTVDNWKALLTQEVLLKVPAARRVCSDGPEESQAVFVLPDRHDVDAITALLEELEKKRHALNVASYGVSDTSLEEIFLRVAENKANAETPASSDVVTLEDDSSACDLFEEPLSGWRLLVQQYVALTMKRYHYVRRDPRALFTQLVLPAFFVTLALVLSNSQSGAYGPQPDLLLRTEMFGNPAVGFFEQLHDAPQSTWSDRYLSSMLSDGVGFNLAAGDAIRRSERTNDVNDWTCSNSPPSTDAPSVTLPSGELFYNATDSEVEDWLVGSEQHCKGNRYGGVSFGAQYKATPSMLNQADNVKVWFNPDGYHSVPTYLNAINNVLLRASLPAGTDARQYGIATSSWPLPPDPVKKQTQIVDPLELSVVLSSAITVIFAMSFVPASFVMFLVEDRVVQTKHLQLVSGLRSYIYWVQTYTWDLVSFLISEILVIIIFLAFQIPSYTSGNNLTAVFLLILTYGMACTPLLYLFSWIFRVPTMAFLVLSTGNLFVGLVTTITIMVMKITADPDVVNVVSSLFLVAPQFCLGQGLMNMAMNFFQNQYLEFQGMDPKPTMSWDVTGKYIVAMLVMSAVLACAVFLAEQSTHWWHGFMQNKSNFVESREAEEEDVRREVQRVDAGHADQGMLVLKRLTKRYARKATPAVAGVSFGVERGQCFGLLGLNGAGKTSIFKMLTGDTLISGGDALVSGRSVRADMDAVRRMTGYCPQFDALVSLLTVKEHLELYSSIHGTQAKLRPTAVRRAIQMFDLEKHQDKQARSLSGGNKRKLSAAISLVGDPSLLYMDEPTTSMDPVARRFVWQRVRRVVAAGRSVLLTSHSMEECEALCDRLTIMVNGKLTCIGSPQHLKHKYGSGYMAVVRCPIERVGEAQSMLLSQMPGTSVKEAHLYQIKLQIPPETLLANIFHSLDNARRHGCVTDYSVSQTTLEDVFMQFAEAQKSQSS